MSNTELDLHDHRILAELQADARLSMAELGRRVHLSQPAVTERVRKLEESGVIRGYRAIVDCAPLGYAIRAVVRVGRADEPRMLRALEASPEVLNAYNITGEDSWLFEIAVRDVAHLELVLQRFCALAQTSTAIVLKVLRQHAPLRPAAALATEPMAAPQEKTPATAVKRRRRGSLT
ncbi:Lrp/AsnC family transcriptional regulator [Roseateles sp. DAIF2]|uniref:Lrp/AsnC family transcriptional regulator n=1 Tax=Roseateles sp. DAIF2 TaxID=2714952 RepID=UPI0018A25929|nr:Lrp/AsnC family transcriptional regulator [Roseateles sp. DAIF2]QPF74488.1 Lrp/AsnC family transcriptional regulator [Roseateles sp. DAIF2]